MLATLQRILNTNIFFSIRHLSSLGFFQAKRREPNLHLICFENIVGIRVNNYDKDLYRKFHPIIENNEIREIC